MYKIISKILVNRLRPFLRNLVTPHQASFVAGCRVSDNYQIANEVLHSFRFKKGKGAFLMAKLDLEKAYDKLSWNSIKEILMKLNFPPQIISYSVLCGFDGF